MAVVRVRPPSLFDNTPLAALLDRLPSMFDQRDLHAVAVTASSYSSGERFMFHDSAQPVAP